MNADEDGRDKARPFPTLPEPRYSRSLERGLAILACFTSERPVLKISEIADGLGISRATTHRYVSTLVSQGHLQRDASRRYRLAPGTIDLGMAALNATGLCRHARPYLQQLSKDTGHTCEIAVLDGPAILLLDSVTARGDRARGDANREAGARLPAYCTSMGKVLLAYLPQQPRLRLISELQLTRYTANTITSRRALGEQLERVRREGLAVNDEELVSAACAVATPVRDDSGDVVAAVNVCAHNATIDLEELVQRFGGQLAATAIRISKRLGWTPDAS
jgi:IclR family pca regulon transcriptional regulator